MQAMKSWLLAATLIAGALAGMGLVESTSISSALAQPPGVVDDHWRFHDGRWSYWNNADRRWYYTDGNHWFYHNGKAWAPYHFDKAFGRKFERGTYRVPAEDVQITLPGHKIYVGP